MRTHLRTALQRGAITTAALAAVASGVLVAAPWAPAAESADPLSESWCERDDRNHWRTVTDLAGARAHRGPGGVYPTLYKLRTFDNFRAWCSAVNGHGNRWYYGERTSGTNGWIEEARTRSGW